MLALRLVLAAAVGSTGGMTAPRWDAAEAKQVADAGRLGRVRLPAADPVRLSVQDATGQPMATVFVREDAPVVLDLPPGRYAIRSEDGALTRNVEVEPGGLVEVDLPGAEAAAPGEQPRDGVSQADAAVPPGVLEGPREPKSSSPAPTHGDWKRVGAPIASALLPGLGQAINREPGKAVGVMVGTVASILGIVATVRARDPAEGATPGDAGQSDAAEIARLSSLVAFSSGLGLLYVGQILDAHARGRGRKADPLRDYKVALFVDRSAAVGLRPGEPSYALYDDYTFSVMGQAHPRVTVGVSDLTVKVGSGGVGDRFESFTFQGGVRSMYRFFDRRRVWLSAGGGAIFQGTRLERAAPELDDDRRETEGEFGAVVYLQGKVRWFLLDRWSLHLQPRVSVPLTDRTYGGGRKIPRYATTFELGAGLGVLF